MIAASEYVARPVRVDAVQWDGALDTLPEAWRAVAFFSIDRESSELLVPTPEGPSRCRVGDYVVRGTAAEFYPVRRPIFEHKYEAVAS